MDRVSAATTGARSRLSGRREILAAALAGAGASILGCSDGGSSRALGAGLPGASPDDFVDPTSAAEYLSTMHLGIQACNYLETAYEPAGDQNAVYAGDFDRIRNDAGLDHVRIPANCAARANVSGLISETFLLKVDAQITLALDRFERVVLDPLHHYLQWKGDHTYDAFYDDHVAVAALTADQHAVRATAMWVQLATRYKDLSTRLSFDLFNEPMQVRRQADYPLGLSAEQLNAWHAIVVAAIRGTGGNSARRMIWLQPWANQLDQLLVPVNVGPLGVSPHYYNPIAFTMGPDAISAAGMADYVECIKYAKNWGAVNDVAMWVGESGVSLDIAQKKIPRPDAERAEFVAHIRNTGREFSVPICYWGYNSDYALFEKSTQEWHRFMLQAITAQPVPLPVRPIPAYTPLQGGRILKAFDPDLVWQGFHYAAETGVLTCAANDGATSRSVILVFPDIAVASQQSWIVRALDFSGRWRIGNCPFFFDPTQPDKNGVLGLDHRAQDADGMDIFPQYRAPAPEGFQDVYGTIASVGTFLGVDLILDAGSLAGHISFECIRVS